MKYSLNAEGKLRLDNKFTGCPLRHEGDWCGTFCAMMEYRPALVSDDPQECAPASVFLYCCQRRIYLGVDE